MNLFPSQLYDGDIASFALATIGRHGLPPSCLEIEITENIAVRRESGVTEPLKQLIEAGVGIAFDDFGTGYGSLSYLKRVPVTRLKIDRSFVRGVIADPGDAAIIRAVIALGRSLGLGVIAEGDRDGIAAPDPEDIRLRRGPRLSLRQADACRGFCRAPRRSAAAARGQTAERPRRQFAG